MKVSKEQAAENRERVLEVAARLYREHGFDGVGVADIMKAAGLTHGGFYGQFASKEALMAEASERAVAQADALWGRLIEKSPEDPLAAITAAYLSIRHRDEPGNGCAMAALGADISRSSTAVRRSVTQGFSRLLGVLTDLMPGRSKSARRDKALVAYASMVGAVVLARAVENGDLSEEILRVVSASLPKSAAQVSPGKE